MSAYCPVDAVTIALGKSCQSRALSSSTALVEAVVVVEVLVVVAEADVVVEAVAVVVAEADVVVEAVAVVVAEVDVVVEAVAVVVAEAVADVVVDAVAVVVAEAVPVVVVVHSENVPVTQEAVVVKLVVTVAMDVLVEVRVIDTNRALPSAGEFMPESTKSSMSLMYSLFRGGKMGGRLKERAIKQDSCMIVLIVA